VILIGAPIRGSDKQGSGAYMAPRGSRFHRGLDIACYAGSEVYSVSAGIVTKIGYPYDPRHPIKGKLRYVEVQDGDGMRSRYFYVSPLVEVGDVVRRRELIGVTQGLINIYPGITDHFHFEVKSERGQFLNPHDYLDKKGVGY